MKILKYIFNIEINLKFKTTLMCALFLLLINSEMPAKEEYTPYSIKAGGLFQSNFYFSDFTEFEGYSSCCQNYNYAFGLGYSGFLGVEYLFTEGLFGLKTSADLLVSYQNISANYDIEEKFANIINGNSFVDGILSNTLNPQIYLFLLEPGIIIEPFNQIPMSLRLGLQFGVPLGMTFTQQAKIISPDWIYFKETGSKIKYDYSGDIPNPSKFYFGLNLSAKYSLMKISNRFSISPIVAIHYGLTNLVSDKDWKYASIQLGLSVDYKIPKPKNIPPMDPPKPDYPNPIQPIPMKVDIVVYNDDDICDSSYVLIPVFERKFISTNMLVPIIFYKVNTSEKLDLSKSQVRTEELTQSLAYESVVNYLNNNPTIKVEIISSSLISENSDTVKTRKETIMNYLLNNSIDANRITIKDIQKDDSKMERSELLEDNCFIRFDFSDKKQMLTFWTDTIVRRIVNDEDFNIIISAESDLNKYSFQTNINFNNNIIVNSNVDKFNFSIDSAVKSSLEELKATKIFVDTKVKNEIFGEKSKTFQILLQPKIIHDGVFENVISDIEESNYVQQLVLGFCEFDQSELSVINYDALKIIKLSYAEGKLIEIIPLFDFLGTDEHNLKLATARANSAIKLLNLEKDRVNINIPKDYFFSNDIPYGRMMNRAVIVRIKDINSK